MKPKSSHRYRVCGTPVRTGCITCKIRRVKCGEEKPHCKRCTSTGRKCDGYAAPTAAKTSSPTKTSIPARLPLSPFADSIEQSTLSFFTTFTAPKLSGSFSSSFWERRVMQASMTEPCVRHGVIALGAVHQDFISRHENWGKNRDPSTEAFAFRQYTKAISYLHQLMSTRTQQLDITLIACILFICFDCLLGNHTSAIIHLKAGLKILEDIKLQNSNGATFAQTTSAYEWEREFSPLLLALGVQAACFVNPKLREDRSALWTALKRAGIPTNPTTFSSLEEARHALDTLAAEVMTDRTSTTDRITEHKIPNPNGVEGQRHIAALQVWEEALESSLPEIDRRECSSSKIRTGATMLKIHGEFLSTVIGIPEPAGYKFEKLLDLCESLTPTRSDCPSQLSFSIDMGLIGPIFFTALRAPQKSIQRRAYALLLQAPGREGMWDTEDAIRLAGEALGVTTHHEPSSSSGNLILPSLCPQHEARTWTDISEKLDTRLSWPYGQKEEPVTPPSFIHGFPFTWSVPTGSGLPFTKDEHLAADQRGM